MIIKDSSHVQEDRSLKRRQQMREQCFAIQRQIPDASLDLILSAVLATKGRDRKKAHEIVFDHMHCGGSMDSAARGLLEAKQRGQKWSSSSTSTCYGQHEWLLHHMFEEPEGYFKPTHQVEVENRDYSEYCVVDYGRKRKSNEKQQQQQQQKSNFSQLSQRERDRMLDDLSQVFPQCSREALLDELDKHRWNVDNTMDHLLQLSSDVAVDNGNESQNAAASSCYPEPSAPPMAAVVDNVFTYDLVASSLPDDYANHNDEQEVSDEYAQMALDRRNMFATGQQQHQPSERDENILAAFADDEHRSQRRLSQTQSDSCDDIPRIQQPVFQFPVSEEEVCDSEEDSDDSDDEFEEAEDDEQRDEEDEYIESEDDNDEVVIEVSSDDYRSFVRKGDRPLAEFASELQLSADEDFARRLQEQEMRQVDRGVFRSVLKRYRSK